MRATTIRYEIPAFLVFWAVVVMASVSIVRSTAFALRPDLMAAAVVVDTAILVPTVFLLVARRLGWPLGSVVPVTLLAVATAHLVVPPGHRGALDLVGLLLVPVEIAAVLMVARRARAIRDRYRRETAGVDGVPEALERAVAEVIGPGRIAAVIATEIAVIHYALFAWGRRPDPRPGTFSSHRECGHGAVVGVFVALLVLETGALHLFLLPRWPVVAWVLFALGVYGTLFLLADVNAARLRPIRVEGGALDIRVALRWRVRVPLDAIDRVDPAPVDLQGDDELLKAVLLGDGELLLHLDRPVMARGAYGIERRVRRIVVGVDDPAGLATALDRRVDGAR